MLGMIGVFRLLLFSYGTNNINSSCMKYIYTFVFLLQSLISFSQQKLELKVGVGTTYFFNSQNTNYILLNPLLNGSIHFLTTKKTLIGMDLQYEWLQENVFPNYYGPFRFYTRRDQILSFGVSGKTYLEPEMFYLNYGFRLGRSLVSSTTYSVTNSSAQVVVLNNARSLFFPFIGFGINMAKNRRVVPYFEMIPTLCVDPERKGNVISFQFRFGIML